MNLTKSILNYLFSIDIFKMLFQKLKVYFNDAKGIPWQQKYFDVMAVLRKIWFFLFFQIFAVIAFFLLPQGADILQCLIEDFLSGKFAPSVILILGVTFWSLTGEFGARLLLYLNDTDNTTISNKRKVFRQRTKKLLPAIQLMFPFVLFLIALPVTFFHHLPSDQAFELLEQLMESQIKSQFFIAFCVLLGLFLFAFRSLLRFYFLDNKLHRAYFSFNSDFEKRMTDKLEGILKNNEEYNAGGDTANTDSTKKSKLAFINMFPNTFGKLKFYIAAVLVLFVLTGILLGHSAYYYMGTAAILCIGISCWLTVFYSIRAFEIIQPFNARYSWLNLPYTTLLFVLLIFVSYTNSDHPIRTKTTCNCLKPRYNPKEFLNAWMSTRKHLASNDTVVYCAKKMRDSTNKTVFYTDSLRIKRVPILFIGAEGGAFRTGAFTSLLLGAIQDSFPDFKSKIFAYSTVSGGTFGANLFNATAFADTTNCKSNLFNNYITYFENTDFLAPVAAKLMFGDFIGYFTPGYHAVLDREVALEEGWENSWGDYLKEYGTNKLYANFYEATDVSGKKPAVFINSAVAENGNRAIVSNVKLGNYFNDVLDVNEIVKEPMSYATAISISARFPLISPAAKVQIDNNHKVHLVDGGYFDNLGNTTMLELLNALQVNIKKNETIQIVPIVIQTVFDGSETKDSKGISLFNEFSEIIGGIVSMRSGHTQLANTRLKQKIAEMGGRYLEIKVASNNEEVPNNWVLSKYAVENAKKRILKEIMNQKTQEGKELFEILKLLNVNLAVKQKPC